MLKIKILTLIFLGNLEVIEKIIDAPIHPEAKLTKTSEIISAIILSIKLLYQNYLKHKLISGKLQLWGGLFDQY